MCVPRPAHWRGSKSNKKQKCLAFLLWVRDIGSRHRFPLSSSVCGRCDCGKFVQFRYCKSSITFGSGSDWMTESGWQETDDVHLGENRKEITIQETFVILVWPLRLTVTTLGFGIVASSAFGKSDSGPFPEFRFFWRITKTFSYLGRPGARLVRATSPI